MVERIRTIHQILAELTILSEVPATQQHDIVHGGEPNRAPRGPKLSLADEHRQAYERAKTPGQRRRVLEAAEADLQNAKRQRLLTDEEIANMELERSSPQWKRWIVESELDGGQLARKFGVSRQYIHQIRRKFPQ